MTAANSVDSASDKTALDNLLDGDYQITSFERDNDQTYVVWHQQRGDESKSINTKPSLKEVDTKSEVRELSLWMKMLNQSVLFGLGEELQTTEVVWIVI